MDRLPACGNSLAESAKPVYMEFKFLIVMNKGGPARTRSFLLPDGQLNHCSARLLGEDAQRTL
jgi:hypothetical protein